MLQIWASSCLYNGAGSHKSLKEPGDPGGARGAWIHMDPKRSMWIYESQLHYIGSLMLTSGALYLNHFVAKLFSLKIIIIFCLLYCLSPAYILKRTPNIYP